ncbi:hypothetical protein GWI33_001942 [Rhynchophorus ferrugineus]|uniref:Uncharacterized protein n=1 Tax=Rhynchophorus ferrugineus TaxID=354439 RepID=A0A834MLJ9_RHYFE|nr:hypothetical protein GWI33_001942 [Rhynchophorus ferrugineus]
MPLLSSRSTRAQLSCYCCSSSSSSSCGAAAASAVDGGRIPRSAPRRWDVRADCLCPAEASGAFLNSRGMSVAPRQQGHSRRFKVKTRRCTLGPEGKSMPAVVFSPSASYRFRFGLFGFRSNADVPPEYEVTIPRLR